MKGGSLWIRLRLESSLQNAEKIYDNVLELNFGVVYVVEHVRAVSVFGIWDKDV